MISRRIEVGNKAFLVSGRPRFLYSGEIHYFRIPRRDWRKHLRLAGEAGLDTVSTYVPWRWHEVSKGVFDFEGRTNPGRDLRGWLDLAEAEGLDVIARIGPVSNGEMIEEGLPDFVASKKGVMVRSGGKGDSIHHVGAPAYLGRPFLRHVERWYGAVLPEVTNRLASRGGPIIAVQLSNEIGMVMWLSKRFDEGPDAQVLYREFLKERYGSLAALEKAHGVRYGAWNRVYQPDLLEGPEGPMPAQWDRAEFARFYFARYYAHLAGKAGDSGVDTPLIANIPQFWDYDTRGRGHYAPMTSSLFERFEEVSKDIVLGGAYQMRRLDAENFHDIFIATAVVERNLSEGAPAICAELQTGILSDRPKIYPNDVSLLLRTAAATGLGGLNAYMFSGGRNPGGMGQFGPYHEWQAPVSSRGEKRSHYAAMKEFGRIVRTFSREIAESRPVVPAALAVPPRYYESEFIDGPFTAGLVHERNEFLFDGIARLLLLDSIPFSWVDPSDPPDLPSLAAFSLDWMDAPDQEGLLSFVRKGGRLFLGPEIPVRDSNGRPCEILSKGLGITPSGRIDTGPAEVFSTPCHLFRPARIVKGKGRVLASIKGRACGLRTRVGRGEALFLGIGLTDRFDYYRDVFRRIERFMRISPPVSTSNDRCVCTVRKGISGDFIFVFNYHDEPAKTSIEYGKRRLRVSLGPREARVLPFGVTSHGIRIDYTEAEIHGLGRRISGRGSRGEKIAFTRKGRKRRIRLTADGRFSFLP